MSVSVTAKVIAPPLFDHHQSQYSQFCSNTSASITANLPSPNSSSRSGKSSVSSPSQAAYHYQVAFFATEDSSSHSPTMTATKTQQQPGTPTQANHRKQASMSSNKSTNPPPKKPSSGRRSARPPSSAGDDSARNSTYSNKSTESPQSIEMPQPEQQKTSLTKPLSQQHASPQLPSNQQGKNRNRRVKSSDPLTTVNSFQQQPQQSPQQQQRKGHGKKGSNPEQSPTGEMSSSFKSQNGTGNHSYSDSEKSDQRQGNGKKKGNRNGSPTNAPESVFHSAQRLVEQQPLSDETRTPTRRRLSAPDAAFRLEDYSKSVVPKEELYAGANFQNSPAASALPLPNFTMRGSGRPSDSAVSALSTSLKANGGHDSNVFVQPLQHPQQQPSPFLTQLQYANGIAINGYGHHHVEPGMRLSHSYTEPSGYSASLRKYSDEPQYYGAPIVPHPFAHMANLHNTHPYVEANNAPSRSPSIRRVAASDPNAEHGMFSMEDDWESTREERRKKSRDLLSLLTGGDSNRTSVGSTGSQQQLYSSPLVPPSVVSNAGTSQPSTPSQTTPPVDLMQISRDLKDMLRITG